VLDLTEQPVRGIYERDLLLLRPDMHVVWRTTACHRIRRNSSPSHGTVGVADGPDEPGGFLPICASRAGPTCASVSIPPLTLV